MAIEIIDLGTVPLDGSDGDVAREAFEKVNANFAEHESEIDAIIPRVDTLENEVGQLEIQAGQIQGDLTNLTESFNVLSSEVGSNTADIQNLENSREYTLVAGEGITIDRSTPTAPIISSTGSSGSVWGQITGNISEQEDLQQALNTKVDKVEGKQLSTEDYTAEDKSKLSQTAQAISSFILDLQDADDVNKGASLVGFDNETVYSALKKSQVVYSSFVFPSNFDILSLEQGATDPIQTAAKFEQMRLYAEANKSFVIIPFGTYVLPQGVRIDADNTTWFFSGGAVLKLQNSQATDDFLVSASPVNQRIFGLRVDASRSSQNSEQFGIDNCALIVVDANNCRFDGIEIISSPAKGFALVSSAGGTNKDVFITNFRGKDCNNQVLLIDGNNMTGLFERIVIDGVVIGQTSHAGLSINDGAFDIIVSNVIADVQNTIWDAVMIRDSWDIQVTNVRGKRGRNGIQIQRLNGFCGRIQMTNVVGELSSQNGVLMLGAENIVCNSVVGRNNAAAGINIAATSAGYRCKNINLSSVSGYDDRTSPAQQWGILVQGVDGCRLGKHIAYGNTNRNVSVLRGSTTLVDADIFRVSESATGSVAPQSQSVITLTFTETMDDAVYDVQTYVVVGTTGRSLAIGHIVARTASAVQVLVQNLHATLAQEGIVYAKVTRRI